MYQEDFILRMVRQFTQVLARVLGLVNNGRYFEGLAAIRGAYRDLFGLDSSSLLYLEENDLLEMNTASGEIDLQRVLALAELLIAEGDIHLKLGNLEEGNARQLKALNLLLRLASWGEISLPVPVHKRIESLASDLGGQGLPAETAAGLFFYYEDSGRFAKAWDVLLDYRKSSPNPQEILPHCIAFLRRLQALPEPDLIGGGLSRHEVGAALDALLEEASGRG